MEFSFDKPDDVPMSVKMERALAAFKRMTPAEVYQGIFVKAGLMTPAEAEEATRRATSGEKLPRKSRSPRPSRAKKSAKPRRA
jgi:hypothetical protein